MLYVVETRKTIEEIMDTMPDIAAKHHFGLLSVIDLGQKMRDKGVAFGDPCVVFEFCNPWAAQQVLEQSPSMAAVLPCRIAAYREKDGTLKLATIHPGALIELFGAHGLANVAEEIDRELRAVIDETAG